MTASCRSCGAEIEWATTAAGKTIPLDAKPVPDGNLAVHRDDRGSLRARALVVDEAPEPGEHRAVSHFATCPHAANHRRSR